MVSITLPKSTFQTLMFSENEFKPMLDYMSVIGVKVNIKGDQATVSGLTDLELLTVAKAVSLVEIGATLEQFPAWVELTDVTVAIPNTVDLDGTWSDYLIGWSYDGKSYARLPYDGDILKQAVDAGLTVKSQPEMSAISNLRSAELEL